MQFSYLARFVPYWLLQAQAPDQTMANINFLHCRVHQRFICAREQTCRRQELTGSPKASP